MAKITITDLIARLQEIERDFGGHLPVCVIARADQRAQLGPKNDGDPGYIVSYVDAFMYHEGNDDDPPTLMLITAEAAQDFPQLRTAQHGQNTDDEDDDDDDRW